MATIIYYGKKGCPPCDFFFKIFEQQFKLEKYQKVILQNNEEALDTVQKFNTRFIPFVVINNNTVIHTEDLKTLLFALKAKSI